MNTFASTSTSVSNVAAVSAETAVEPTSRVLPGLLKDPAARRAVRAAWKAYVAEASARSDNEHPGPSARDLAVYCLLLGKPLSRAFTPITNDVKLANGQRPWASLMDTLASLDRFHRGLDLQPLLMKLQAPRVEVPNQRIGSGVQLGYTRIPVREELLQAARAVTVAQLEAGLV